EFYLRRACIYTQLEQYDRAIDDCSTAIQLNPGCLGAYNLRAYSYLRCGPEGRAHPSQDLANKALADYSAIVAKSPYNQSSQKHQEEVRLLVSGELIQPAAPDNITKVLSHKVNDKVTRLLGSMKAGTYNPSNAGYAFPDLNWADIPALLELS